ncbi:MAG: hypothetical protein AAGF25_09785 [Pseudomonadota bacterium]
MKDVLKRKKRLLRIQKSVLAKSEMDFAATIRAKHALKNQIEEINALVEGEGISARVFPKLTYQHLKNLMVQSDKLEVLNGEKREAAIREKRKLELFDEAVSEASTNVAKSNEAMALAETADRTTMPDEAVSATDKFKKLD